MATIDLSTPVSPPVPAASRRRIAIVAASALIPFTFAAIAEESGWRGYLTPRLEAAGVGRLANHTLVGVIWGAWHLPYLDAWDYSTESLWTLAARIILGTTVIADIRRSAGRGGVYSAILNEIGRFRSVRSERWGKARPAAQGRARGP
jgi:hypothetical protein